LSAVKSIFSLASKIGNYKAMKSCFLNGLLGQAPSKSRFPALITEEQITIGPIKMG